MTHFDLAIIESETFRVHLPERRLLAVIPGSCHVHHPKSLRIDSGTDVDAEITADQFVIAAGAQPTAPLAVRASGVPSHTSETVMQLDELPKRLVILGSGFMAAELAHVFSALGSRVTVVASSNAVMRQLDTETSQRFTAVAQEHWGARLNTKLSKVTSSANGNPNEGGPTSRTAAMCAALFCSWQRDACSTLRISP